MLTGNERGAGGYLTKSAGSPGAGDMLMGFLGSVILSFAFSMYRQRKVGILWNPQQGQTISFIRLLVRDTFQTHLVTELRDMMQVIQRHAAEIITAVVVSSLFSLYSTAALGRLLGIGRALTSAIIPRCVTVALALPIASLLEGMFDVICGFSVRII